MIKQLQIKNFRNYKDVKLIIPETDHNIVVLYGNNGEGKTNILESISLFSEMGGLRRAKYEEIINRCIPEDVWSIVLNTPDCEFFTGYTRQSAKRIYKINGNPARNMSDFLKDYCVLWLTYEMDRLFIRSPADRRDFIDMFGSVNYPQHISNVRSYEKLTKQRLKILKNHIHNPNDGDTTKWLDILEDQIVDFGIKIATTRIETVKKLEENQINDGFPAFKNEMTGLLETSILNADNSCRAESYRRELHDRRERDGFSGSTTMGPNKSDWKVLYVGKDIDASMCSAGEQKMLLSGVFLSFVLSHLQSDERRLILLLDDVVAHLDTEHRTLLFSHIRDFMRKHIGKVSVWLSGTSKELFSELKDDAIFFRVRGGFVEEVNYGSKIYG
ncbi:MAG: AAA family ATPase [Holosporales bacterium]|jgi:DNA replication and repair protein RecF|nr:AAA family ATPase [Holosporales bacterium]